MKLGRVYIVKNSQNTLVYIGSTFVALGVRLSRHRLESRTGTSKWYQAIREIGGKKFGIELLEEREVENREELDRLEFDWIAKYKPEELYNTDLEFRKRSEETREKLILASKRSEYDRVGCNNPNFKRGSVIHQSARSRFMFKWYEGGERKVQYFSYGVRSSWNEEEALLQAEQFRNSMYPPRPRFVIVR